MRKVMVLVAIVSLIPAALLAQPKQAFSLFAVGVNSGSQDEQRPVGFGIAYDRMLTQRFSLGAAIAYERHFSYPYVVDVSGFINVVPKSHLRTVPVDVTARYHWLNGTRWKPYIGAGAHYVAAPKVHLDPGFGYQNHIDGEVDGGVAFMFTPALGVMLDGRVIGGERETYDPIFRISAGLSWRF